MQLFCTRCQRNHSKQASCMKLGRGKLCLLRKFINTQVLEICHNMYQHFCKKLMCHITALCQKLPWILLPSMKGDLLIMIPLILVVASRNTKGDIYTGIKFLMSLVLVWGREGGNRTVMQREGNSECSS